jgi:serine/threonine protein kinase
MFFAQVIYRQLSCAGKKLHGALMAVENEGVAEMARRYLRECHLMSAICHPNIIQFLGICFLPGTPLPVLVMERLETSLDDLLENMPDLPLSLKRSILEEVASGLLYLHKRPSPVIHRDLTARNVLLTSSLVAKISDLGSSRIVDMSPGQMARTLSSMPGTLVYMPPEALDDRHHYGPALDIFSFGHLALFTIIQVN